jgi:thymidylate synthase ThyX
VTVYVAEDFTPAESDVLRRYFTNLDSPVFALVNLPEVVKGALFARYSRSSKSLRRLFLDEFVAELDVTGDASIDATIGLRRAEELYDRVFFEYGDDSVAQLGGVHLACEQASNVLTKVLEWGRLMSYLEQSTRYIPYDTRIGGRYRYYRDPEVLQSSLGTRYVGDMDRLFDSYGQLVPVMSDFFRDAFPKGPGDSDFVHRQAIRAKAFDTLRGILPAASLSNVGIYGTGQGYEALLLRMRSHWLPEARAYADMMLVELRKVIPSFLKRVDLPGRGVAWSDYLESTRTATADLAAELLGDPAGSGTGAGSMLAGDDAGAADVTLVDHDPDAEVKMVAAMLYPHSHLGEADLEQQVRAMSTEDRLRVVRAYTGDRSNRRHKPGRALERCSYRFDVLADYGAFRDLQRHRMLTVDWQQLSPRHGYVRPAAVELAGCSADFDEAMERSALLHDAMVGEFPNQAPYAVSFGYRVRFSMQMNAREAMHLIELRTTPQGHAAYRRVAQEMHRLIAEQAGHHAVAEMMRFVDLSPDPGLERLESERRAEQRRQQ